MKRDPAALRLEASAYRELAFDTAGASMRDALQQTASALDALAHELESEQDRLTPSR
jgi:hypothetical protein